MKRTSTQVNVRAFEDKRYTHSFFKRQFTLRGTDGLQSASTNLVTNLFNTRGNNDALEFNQILEIYFQRTSIYKQKEDPSPQNRINHFWCELAETNVLQLNSASAPS